MYMFLTILLLLEYFLMMLAKCPFFEFHVHTL